MKRNHWIIAGLAAVGVAMLAAAFWSRSGSVSADGKADGSSQSIFSRLTGPREERVMVPAGTRLSVRLDQAISSEKNSAGDLFQASLDGPLTINGKTVAPRSTKVVGLLTDVTDSGRVQGKASMTLVLRKLVVGEEEYDLTTEPRTFVAQATKKRDAAVIGGGAAAGAVIGAIAGGGKGAAIGAGIGGGSGTGYVLATKGEPVAYGPETRFTFALAEPLDVPVYKN